MGPPLGPVLAGIFMVELENTLATTLSNLSLRNDTLTTPIVF